MAKTSWQAATEKGWRSKKGNCKTYRSDGWYCDCVRCRGAYISLIHSVRIDVDLAATARVSSDAFHKTLGPGKLTAFASGANHRRYRAYPCDQWLSNQNQFNDKVVAINAVPEDTN
jgi:hypothetical protein